MQKKLIALAIAGLASTAAFAQSNVTLYGIVDVGYARISVDGKPTTSAIDNGMLAGSRLGFKGEEALGDGMSAVFNLEYMLAPDVNSGLGSANGTSKWTSTESRNTYAGLKGTFGTVVAGRLQGIGYAHACTFNPIAGNSFDPFGGLGAQSILGCGGGGRHDNAVAWMSPNMNGITVAYNHARVTETAATNATGSDSSANVFGAMYANGPLQLGFAYARVGADATAAADDWNEMGLGANYDFGAVKVFTNYQSRKVENAKRDSKFLLGVALPVSASDTLSFAYGTASIDSKAKADAKSMALQYVHAMSKRTKLYGGYKRVNNDDAAAVGIATGFTPVAGGKASVLGFGINHSF